MEAFITVKLAALEVVDARSHDACLAATTFDEASAILEHHASALGTETVSLRDCVGRVLASPVYSQIDAPRTHVSAMDGYAVNDVDLDRGIAVFNLAGQSFPGNPLAKHLGVGETVRIFTGAPIPAGSTRVIPQENASLTGSIVTFGFSRGLKRHIRTRGSDFQTGDVLLQTGTLIEPRHLVAIAGGDAATVNVARQPSICFVATGDELSEPGRTNFPNQIPESISHSLAAFVEQWGGRTVASHILPDEPTTIASAVRDALANVDVIVMIGGASKGSRDFAKAALQPLGLILHFSEVAMKPGKPIWYGRIGRTHILGLPGNPTAAITTARLFLAPLICALIGRPYRSALDWIQVPTRSAISRGDGRDQFLCAQWREGYVSASVRQEASSQITLVCSNALLRRRAFAEITEPGTSTEVLLI